MKARAIASEPVNVGFQIAPMIDVVFVIMLFFMVMASSIKSERRLAFGIPSPTTPDSVPVPPTELDVVIADDGAIMMNEEEYDAVGQKSMPLLTTALQRISADATARGDKVLVIIRAEEQASYDRIIDVMNAMAKAKLTNVTFTVGGE